MKPIELNSRYKGWKVTLLFTVIAHLFYAPAWQAGMVGDFTGLLWRLENAPWYGFLWSYSFPAVQPLLNAGYCLIFNLFGLHTPGWYLVFTSLHIWNAWLVFQLMEQLQERFSLRLPAWAGVGAGLVFLLSPYQSEVVVYKVCLSYLLTSALMLNILIHLTQQRSPVRFGWILALSAAACLVFEYGLLIPFMVLGLRSAFWRSGVEARWKSWWLPALFALVPVYFLLNRLMLGVWIGHYGAGTHLNIQPLTMLGTLWKYSAKHLLFLRYLDNPIKEQLFNYFDRPVLVGVLTLLFLAGLFWTWYRKYRSGLVIGLLLFWAVLPLAMVSNIFFSWLEWGYNDRYGYLPTAFGAAAGVWVLSKLPSRLGLSFLGLWLLTAGYWLYQTNQRWRESAAVMRGLVEGFHWENAPELYILSSPDNYRGLYMMPDNDAVSGVRDALYYLGGKKVTGEWHQIAQFNMGEPGQGTRVQLDSAGHLRVVFNQWGNWWWRANRGASDFEKEGYTVRFQGHFYDLHFKKAPHPEAVFIYQNGAVWEELTGTRRDTLFGK